MLSDDVKSVIRELGGKYPDRQSAVLPALSLAQAALGGWLPAAAIDEVAGLLGLSSAQVGAAASFYSMLNLRPVGRHRIYVCTNIACSLLGAGHILNVLSARLGIRPGETTADGRFTLFEAECLGSCGTAPMMQVDETYYENLTEAEIERILAELANGD